MNYLSSVAAVSANEAWAVGFAGTFTDLRALVLRWDGSAWSEVALPVIAGRGSYLYGVHATSSTNVWAVGYLSPESG
jgi:hypothetical protein